MSGITYVAKSPWWHNLNPLRWFSGKPDPDHAVIISTVQERLSRIPTVMVKALEQVGVEITGTRDSRTFDDRETTGGAINYDLKKMWFNIDWTYSADYLEEPYHYLERHAFKKGLASQAAADEAVRQALLPNNQSRPEIERCSNARRLSRLGQKWYDKKESLTYGGGKSTDSRFNNQVYPEARVDLIHIQKFLVEMKILEMIFERLPEIEKLGGNNKDLGYLRALKNLYDKSTAEDIRTDEYGVVIIAEKRAAAMSDSKYITLRERVLESMAQFIGYDEVVELNRKALAEMKDAFGPLFEHYKNTMENIIPTIAGIERENLQTMLINRNHPLGRSVVTEEVGIKQHEVATATAKQATDTVKERGGAELK